MEEKYHAWCHEGLHIEVWLACISCMSCALSMCCISCEEAVLHAMQP